MYGCGIKYGKLRAYTSAMPDETRFLLFLPAAVLLAVTPGPGIFYVLGRTINGGKRDGALSCMGTFVGGLVHVFAAALGLSAILATSAAAFQIVRYAGAAYLVYLGIMMIRTRHVDASSASELDRSSRAWLQGITTEVLNPKTALFFLSFIPQFVSPDKPHLALQFMLLGSISVLLNTTADLLVVVFAGVVAQRLRQNKSFNARQRALSGAGMIGLGVYVAVADGRHS
jgi:threonine/homoserine/homoserine lactone efflux protein